jgi:RHS repeat-associated protein
MRNVPIFLREGNIVKLTDGNGGYLTDFVILDRGYTGHEHLTKVGIIHMNGRLYDPLLHRFLQPDNYVQDPQTGASLSEVDKEQ